MDQQAVLIKRPCQRAHFRGQEEVIAVCLNKDCLQRLCCINCRKDSYHQGHLGKLCHFDFLLDQLEEEFTAYKSVGILSLIEGKIQEFNKTKAEFLKAFDLLETDFLKRVQRVREVDLLICESIKMVETKEFELFTEIQSQALVELRDNSFVERLKRLICEDPLISELKQLNTELVSKIQATKIAKFIQKRSSDPLQVEYFFQNRLSQDQIPLEMKLIIEERIGETNEGNQFFFGGFQSNFKHGSGILVKQEFQEIIEGIWENDSIKWGFKLEKSKINQNINYHYVGMLQNDNREGKGITKYSSGDSYEGDWKNDKRDGKGIIKYSNGNSFEGGYKNDKKEGKGIFIYSNGDIEEGLYQEGLSIAEHKVYKLNSTKPYKINIYGQNGNIYAVQMLE